MSDPGPSKSGDTGFAEILTPGDRLRRLWLAGGEPDLDAFVAELHEVSPRDLAELIQVDLEARWRRADRRLPEDYLRSFPAVASDLELTVDVVYAEFLAREQAGEQPELADYQTRFPAIAPVLADQVRLHHAFDELEQQEACSISSAAVADLEASTVPGGTSDVEDGYEILEQIGSGGMGVVYKARQTALDRLVAIKMVRTIDSSNQELLARFRSEARVVATLHHPHIVQVHDYGQHGDLPYIAMELVEGGTLADRLDGTPWAPREAAALLIDLADAVHFAHARQVVHRDLKPANVLIDCTSGGLDVKIADFGLAKFLADDPSLHTKSYTFLGTPSYMAPEQAHGHARDIGPATDIYSLGAIFCELLTGHPPFRGDTPVETLRLLLSTEPTSLTRLSPRTPRDLATICDTCLQSHPKRRYASAAALREDLQRFLDGRPIQARPISAMERSWRWSRRNPLLASAFVSVALLLVGIAVVSLWYSARLSRELMRTRQAERAEHAANQAAQGRLWDLYLSEAAARNASRQVGQRYAALASIDRATELLKTMGREPVRELQLRNAVLASVALPDIREVGSFPAAATTCDLSLSANYCVVVNRDATIGVHRLSDGKQLSLTPSNQNDAAPVLTRDGRYLATIGPSGLKVWRIEQDQPQPLWERPEVHFFGFALDGLHAACGTEQEGMRLVRIDTGEIVRALGSGVARSRFCFDPSRGRVAVCVADNVQVISTASGAIELELPLQTIRVEEPLLDWSPDGNYLAVWTDSADIDLWDVSKRTKVGSFMYHGMPAQLRFSADGSLLSMGSIWNSRFSAVETGTGQRLLDVPDLLARACDRGTNREIVTAFFRNEKVVISELVAGECRALARSLHKPLGYWASMSINPEGRLLACSSTKGLEIWDLWTAQRLFVRAIGLCFAQFDDQGRLVVGCEAGLYRFSRRNESVTGTGAESEQHSRPLAARTIVHFEDPEPLFASLAPMSISANAKADSFFFATDSDWTFLHAGREVRTRRWQPQGDPRKSAVSNNGHFAAIASWEQGGAEVWDTRRGEKVTELGVGRHGVLQFSPDGKWLAASPDGVTLWRTADWQRAHNLHAMGTSPTGLGIAFSPDSRVLAVGQVNGVILLVDPQTGAEWARLSHRDQSAASNLEFSSDQRWLVTSSTDERSPAQVWDLAALRHALAERNLDWPADVLQVRPGQSEVAEYLEIALEDGRLLPASP